MSLKQQRLKAARERYEAELAFINRPLPKKWKVGMKVRYVANKDWAWSKGAIATIDSFKDEPAPTAEEYQVFYTVPESGYGIYWTTPNDVEWIEE